MSVSRVSVSAFELLRLFTFRFGLRTSAYARDCCHSRSVPFPNSSKPLPLFPVVLLNETVGILTGWRRRKGVCRLPSWPGLAIELLRQFLDSATRFRIAASLALHRDLLAHKNALATTSRRLRAAYAPSSRPFATGLSEELSYRPPARRASGACKTPTAASDSFVGLLYRVAVGCAPCKRRC